MLLYKHPSILEKIIQIALPLRIFNDIPEFLQKIIDNKFDEDKILDLLVNLKEKIDKTNVFKLDIDENLSIRELENLKRICRDELSSQNKDLYYDLSNTYDVLYEISTLKKYIKHQPFIGDLERSMISQSINLIILNIKQFQLLASFNECFSKEHHKMSLGLKRDLLSLMQLEKQRESLHNNAKASDRYTYRSLNSILKDMDEIKEKWHGKINLNNFRHVVAYLLAEIDLSAVELADKLDVPKYTFINLIHNGIIFTNEYNKLCDYFSLDSKYPYFYRYCV